MDLLGFIIIATIISIVIGCCFLANTDTIGKYFSSILGYQSASEGQNASEGSNAMDNNDINYIKYFLSGKIINDIIKKISPLDTKYSPDTKCSPDAPIPDIDLIRNNGMIDGEELPQENEISH
jgi:hypothetical protein